MFIICDNGDQIAVGATQASDKVTVQPLSSGAFWVSFSDEVSATCTIDELMEFACAVLEAQVTALQMQSEAIEAAQ